MYVKVINWVEAHDEKWLFTFLYIGLSVFLSLAISLFWLLIVVLCHALLEILALRNKDEKNIYKKVFWHLKLDFGLVLFALCLAIYIETAFGFVGLGAAARTGAQFSTRIVIWQRTIRGIFLTIDDAAQVSKALLSRNNKSDENAPNTLPWKNKWGIGDWISISLLVICILLFFLSPILLNQDVSSLAQILSTEMHPWP